MMGGVLRINAIGAGAVEYLLEGSGCVAPERSVEGGGPVPEGQQLEAGVGGGAEYLQGAVEHGERAGQWVGNGLEFLGVDAGEAATEEQVRAIFGELKDPRTDEYLGRPPRQFKSFEERAALALLKEPAASDVRRAEIMREVKAATRRPVAYYDFTFSPVKSASVYYAAALAAGDTERAAAVLAAHDAAVATAIEHAEEHAYVRTGYHGRRINGSDSVGKYEKAEGLAVLAFGHSTNREGEPQLHTHAAVLNRAVTASDGQIRALHGAGWRKVKEAMATTYERTLEKNLSDSLGVEWVTRPDGKAREIAGVDPELMEAASTRRAQVERDAEKIIAEYKAATGREPGQRARHKIYDTATLNSRRAKEGPQGPAAVVAWTRGRAEEMSQVVSGAAAAARRIARKGHPDLEHLPDQRDRAAIIARGLAQVQTEYSTWTMGNLVRAIDSAVHEVPDGADRKAYVQELADEAVTDRGFGVLTMRVRDVGEVPAELLRPEDGRPLWRAHVDETYTLASHIDREARIVSQASQDGAPAITGPELELLDVELTAAGLTEDQKTAVLGIASSGRGGDVLIGPAGTGKSFAMARLAEAWQGHVGGRVLGLAPSQRAADVLAADGVGSTRNTAKFLADLRTGKERLRAGDLVIVDEAGMASTAALSEISDAAHKAGAKMLYTGDHAQLAAVDAGGMLELLATDHGAHELETVRRFRAEWERDASLRLRDGDVSVVDEYAARGRLYGGTAEQGQAAAVRGYLADKIAGKDTLLVVRTNEEAAEVSRQIQRALQERHRITATEITTLGDGNTAHVGDTVQLRLNAVAWDEYADLAVRRPDGLWDDAPSVTNRELVTVTGMDEAGRLVAVGKRGEIHLPAAYVAEHTTLGYALTVHGAQGQTVDTARSLLDERADRLAAYVALTRGRELNEAYLVTQEYADEHNPNGISHARPRDVLAQVLENTPAERAATLEVREAERLSGSLASLGETFEFLARETAQTRVERALTEALTDEQIAVTQLSDEYGALLARVRQAENDGHDAVELIKDITTRYERDLGDANEVGAVLYWRLNKTLEERQPEHADRVVDPRDWTTLAVLDDDATGDYARTVAAAAARRHEEIGREAVENAPAWAVDVLGPVPDDVWTRAAWQNRAADLGAAREYQQLSEHTPGVGTAPGVEQPVGRALHQAGFAATGADVDQLAFTTASDAELITMRAHWDRLQTWAPADVDEDRERAAQLTTGYAQEMVLYRDTMALHEPGSDEHTAAATAYADVENLHNYFGSRRDQLGEIAEARRAWTEATEEARYRAELAAAELARRGTVEPEQPALFDLPDDQQAAAVPALDERTWHRPDLADPVRDAIKADQTMPAPAVQAPQAEVLFDVDTSAQAGAGPLHEAPAESGTMAAVLRLATRIAQTVEQADQVALAAEAQHARRVLAATAETGVHQREATREMEEARQIEGWKKAREAARDRAPEQSAPSDLASRIEALRARERDRTQQVERARQAEHIRQVERAREYSRGYEGPDHGFEL